MWRPEGWENPHSEEYDAQPHRAVVFERGADAILEGLRSQSHQDWLATPEGESCKGRWVFLPEELK